MNTCDINSWANYTSWQLVRSPSRPAPWQLKVIRERLSNVPISSAIAVLGSTLEFRDLLAELNFKNVFIFERNPLFYKYISTYMKFDCTDTETLVLGNWPETLFHYPEKFAMILSDLTSGNVSYSDRNQFYQGIARALLPDGLFIDRILTKPCEFIPVYNLLRKYCDLEVTNAIVNSFNCEMLFCSTLLENDDNVVDSSAFYDYLLNLDIPRITEFVQACYEITPRDCLWWYSKPWSSEKIIYESCLKVIQAYDEPQTSEYFNRCKLLLSHRKDKI